MFMRQIKTNECNENNSYKNYTKQVLYHTSDLLNESKRQINKWLNLAMVDLSYENNDIKIATLLLRQTILC